MSNLQLFRFQEVAASKLDDAAQSLFHSHSWLSVLEKTYGFEIFIVKSDKIFCPVAAIPQFGEKKISVLPFSDYSDLKVEDSNFNQTIFDFLAKKFPQSEVVLKMHSQHPSEEEKPWGKVSRKAYLHKIFVNKSDDDLFTSNFRWGMRKAIKANVHIRTNNDLESVHIFYKIYKDLRFGKFGSIPQPFIFFQNIYEVFIKNEKGFVLEAVKNQQTIASIVVLKFNNVWYYKFGCSDVKFLNDQPNNLLFTELVRMAREEQVDYIDLGLSGAGKSYEGLVRFKERMGGERSHLIHYQHLSPNLLEAKNRQNHFMKNVTGAMVEAQAPLPFTSKLSETLYPYFG